MRMQLVKKQGNFIYLILLVLHCICIYFTIIELRIVTKILLLPFLMLYLLSFLEKQERIGMLLPILGLFFSFLGDVLLTASGELFFLLGMGAFILTHICNSLFFIKLPKTARRQKRSLVFVIALVVVTLLCWSVNKMLKPHLGAFQLPIQVYMIIIACMAMFAVRTFQDPEYRVMAIRLFIPGAALFLLSDSVLALNKFLFHQSGWDLLVMFTYGGAQYFLTAGFIAVAIKNRENIPNFS